MWTEVIYDPYRKLCQNVLQKKAEDINTVAEKLAGIYYSDLRHSRHLFSSPFSFTRPFCDLNGSEKNTWICYVKEIPSKLKELNLFLRPYKNFCRTCLIAGCEVERLARIDYEKFELGIIPGKKEKHGRSGSGNLSFEKLSPLRRSFYMEMNYLIPLLLKKAGFEIIHPEEATVISDRLAFKMAKAVHSQYLHLLRNQNKTDDRRRNFEGFITTKARTFSEICDFEDLPDEIRSSNIDNAFHIPAKLLSIGYRIKPVSPGRKPLALHLDTDEIETMAMVEHLRWCWDKRLNGWVPGKSKNTKRKTHPDIIPYDKLIEQEKDKDRELVRLIPALLQDIGFEACPVDPGKIEKLSYAIKPQSSIHRILVETRDLNDKIRKMVTLTPEIEKMVSIRNNKIEDAIREIEESYNYARHIQKTFLPEDLFIRECFQDSFVLHKPKDIVSGDFYFFSRQNNLTIFAAADCTGHGIPGALLSTLGYGIIDQAVNEVRLTDPSEILSHLYSRIHRFMRSDDPYSCHSADMDISLCILDISLNILTFSGITSPLYRITGGRLVEYKALNSGAIYGDNGNYSFLSEKIYLNSGDTLYIFSDGFSDQFGGMSHKRYQSSRFKNLLLSVQEYSLPEQSDLINEEIERWRDENNEDQTDDILVIGVKI